MLKGECDETNLKKGYIKLRIDRRYELNGSPILFHHKVDNCYYVIGMTANPKQEKPADYHKGVCFSQDILSQLVEWGMPS